MAFIGGTLWPNDPLSRLEQACSLRRPQCSLYLQWSSGNLFHIRRSPLSTVVMQDIGDQVLAWVQKHLGVHSSQVANLPRVYLHTSYLDDATYRRLYASTDCVVLPTRCLPAVLLAHMLKVVLSATPLDTDAAPVTVLQTRWDLSAIGSTTFCLASDVC